MMEVAAKQKLILILFAGVVASKTFPLTILALSVDLSGIEGKMLQ